MIYQQEWLPSSVLLMPDVSAFPLTGLPPVLDAVWKTRDLLSGMGRLVSGFRSFAARVFRFFCGRTETLAPVVPPGDDSGIALAVDSQPALLPAPLEFEREEPNDFIELFRPILSEIKVRHKQEQQARTRTRMASLFATQSPKLASVSYLHSRFGQSSSSTSRPTHRSPRPPSPESFEPLLPRRKGVKF
jgi:hypothetical protein